jgi:glutathione S-transferase
MTLYSGTDCVLSHACRIVLQEKDIECELVYTDPSDTCQELAEFNPYYETPTLVDVILAPILWRLPTLNIILPKQAQAVEEYSERLFERQAFQDSLSDTERDLRGF